ncbi:unnamed protein product [Sphagnum jensenii]|uniref:Uncharacterized protein n=1 Tax=Sphagnum jensenii TaxID=128206 RepID=A0ABP1A270_9BRYO
MAKKNIETKTRYPQKRESVLSSSTTKSPRLPCRATQERFSLSADPTSTHHHWRHSNLRSLWGTWGFACCSERNPAILETRTRIG